MNFEKVEKDPACFEAEEEGVEEDVFLEGHLSQRTRMNVVANGVLAADDELFVLDVTLTTLRVVSLVMKLWWKPKLGR